MNDIYKPMVRPKDGSLEKKVAEEPNLNDNPEEETNGVMICSGRNLLLYGFDKNVLETIRDNISYMNALAYHKEDLWISHGSCYSSGDITPLKTTQSLFRDSFTSAFFSYNGLLFDAGRYGIRETETGEEHITRHWLDKRNIYAIYDVFPHGKMLLAQASQFNGSGEDFYLIEDINGRLSLGEIYKNHNGRKATSINGKILTPGCSNPDSLTFNNNALFIEGKLIESTKLEKIKRFYNPYYTNIIFDKRMGKVYAIGTDIVKRDMFRILSTVKVFKVEEEGEELDLIQEEILFNTEKEIGTILPVTQEQMEVIREQAKQS